MTKISANADHLAARLARAASLAKDRDAAAAPALWPHVAER
jgi:hypothetical protein